MSTAGAPLSALVLDANQRSALATVRSLGRQGLFVAAADSGTAPLAGTSRYCRLTLRYPDPNREPRAFVAAVAAMVAEHGFDLVLPMTDVTTMLLVDKAASLAPARLGCASHLAYESLTDKSALVSRAQSLGMLVPKTIVARSPAEIAKAADTFGYPFVIKPGRSKYMRGESLASTGVRVVHSAGELEQVVPTLSWLGEIPCLAQEFIPGHGAGVFCLMDGTKAVAWFAHRRIREKPPGGGVSVLSESAPLDPTLQESARQLLTSVGWFGPAMVEYRIDPQGKAYLMEVNGRFWGSLQLAIDSGIDFPWLLCQVLSGPDMRVPTPSASRARMRWLLGDLDRLIILLRDRSYSSSAKLRNVAGFIATCFDLSCKQEIFRWRDPAPALKELRQWLGALR